MLFPSTLPHIFDPISCFCVYIDDNIVNRNSPYSMMDRVLGSWPVITLLLVQLANVHGYRQLPSFFTSIRPLPEALYLQKSLFPETFSAYGIDIPVPLSSRSSLKCEVDYLGMINFCLRKTDTALSGSSKSKMLNAVTNEVFRALMIAFEPTIVSLLDKFKFYDSQLGGSNYCLMDDNNMISLVPPTTWTPGRSVSSGVVNVIPAPVSTPEGTVGGVASSYVPLQRQDVYDMSECRACKMYLEALEGLLRTGAKRSQVRKHPFNTFNAAVTYPCNTHPSNNTNTSNQPTHHSTTLSSLPAYQSN